MKFFTFYNVFDLRQNEFRALLDLRQLYRCLKGYDFTINFV